MVNPFGIVLLSLQSPLARSSGGLQADNYTFTVVARQPVSGKQDRRIFLLQHMVKSLTLAEISDNPEDQSGMHKKRSLISTSVYI